MRNATFKELRGSLQEALRHAQGRALRAEARGWRLLREVFAAHLAAYEAFPADAAVWCFGLCFFLKTDGSEDGLDLRFRKRVGAPTHDRMWQRLSAMLDSTEGARWQHDVWAFETTRDGCAERAMACELMALWCLDEAQEVARGRR